MSDLSMLKLVEQAIHKCVGDSLYLDDAARAAIEALREPSDLMAFAGRHLDQPDAVAIWRAMIDAALK